MPYLKLVRRHVDRLQRQLQISAGYCVQFVILQHANIRASFRRDMLMWLAQGLRPAVLDLAHRSLFPTPCTARHEPQCYWSAWAGVGSTPWGGRPACLSCPSRNTGKHETLARAGVPIVAGSVTSSSQMRKRMIAQAGFRLFARGLEGFAPLAERSGYAIAESRTAVMSEQVLLRPRAIVPRSQ